MPGFTLTGYSAFGNTDSPRPNFYADQSYTSSHNASYSMGKHELRFGFDVVRHQLNHWQPELNNPRGGFTFGGAVTALAGGTAPNQFNSYAAFLLGLPTNAGKSLQYLTMTGREWQFGWYLRDRYQVTPHLTLSLGLRYEYYPLMTRADRGLERYDPTTNLVLIGRRGGNPDNVGIDVSKRFFAPRVGFAYRWGANTVVRSGYGITYDPLPFSRPLRGPYPATISQNFVGANSYTPFASLEQGIPLFTGPDLSTGSFPLPPTVDDRSPWGGRLHRGYIQSWNFIIERKLPGDIATSIGYVGTQTVHALADRDINAAQPGAGEYGAAAVRGVPAHGGDDDVGRLPECELPCVPGIDQPALPRRRADQGGIHVLEVDQLDGRGRVGGAVVELGQRAAAKSRGDGVRPQSRAAVGLGGGSAVRAGQAIRERRRSVVAGWCATGRRTGRSAPTPGFRSR